MTPPPPSPLQCLFDLLQSSRCQRFYSNILLGGRIGLKGHQMHENALHIKKHKMNAFCLNSEWSPTFLEKGTCLHRHQLISIKIISSKQISIRRLCWLDIICVGHVSLALLSESLIKEVISVFKDITEFYNFS